VCARSYVGYLKGESDGSRLKRFPEKRGGVVSVSSGVAWGEGWTQGIPPSTLTLSLRRVASLSGSVMLPEVVMFSAAHDEGTLSNSTSCRVVEKPMAPGDSVRSIDDISARSQSREGTPGRGSDPVPLPARDVGGPNLDLGGAIVARRKVLVAWGARARSQWDGCCGKRARRTLERRAKKPRTLPSFLYF